MIENLKDKMSRYSKYIKRAIRYVIKGQPQVVLRPQIISLGMNSLLEGKCAIVTGGSSGIGFAIAKAFVEAGAKVILTSRSNERAQSAVKKITEILGHSENIFGIEMDVARVEDFAEIIAAIKQQVPVRKIDILVNNAGTEGGDISSTTEMEYDRVMNTNLKSVFFLSKTFASYMIDNGIKGNILNIASSSSLRPARSAYQLSKWGVRALTLGLAKSLAKYDIVVNGLAPGPTVTPMLKTSTDDIYLANSPIGRYILPEEIASVAVMLVSGIGRSILGDTIYMTGGAGLITLDDANYNF